ncbi:hypothetical protein EDB89DRAFT_2244715 [Lactarius sanguifluus]|nr:hypothetical protein EDB89DRAFT_2244715 [Lactarius sanguifluus]
MCNPGSSKSDTIEWHPKRMLVEVSFGGYSVHGVVFLIAFGSLGDRPPALSASSSAAALVLVQSFRGYWSSHPLVAGRVSGVNSDFWY